MPKGVNTGMIYDFKWERKVNIIGLLYQRGLIPLNSMIPWLTPCYIVSIFFHNSYILDALYIWRIVSDISIAVHFVSMAYTLVHL